MRVGVPFPLKSKSLLVAAGVLVPFFAALNGAAWFYGYSLPVGRLVAAVGVLPDVVRGVVAACPAWVWNAAVSGVVLVVGLVAAGARASSTARRIVRLVDTVERFEDGHFDIRVSVGRGGIAAVERSVARMGRSLAVMLRLVNKNMVGLARNARFPLSVETPDVTVAVFRIGNYHEIARRVSPGRLNGLVNGFLARVMPAIAKTGGAVNKIWAIDDFYVLAVWGGVSSGSNRERDAVGALRSCVLIRSIVRTINRDLRVLAKRKGRGRVIQFDVSMGLASGEVLVGPVETGCRRELGILGDVVKAAVRCARIGARSGRQIVMTERTCDWGGAQFVTRKLQGKSAVYFSLVKPNIGADYALP
jgi:class 3 adenylate cyclase